MSALPNVAAPTVDEELHEPEASRHLQNRDLPLAPTERERGAPPKLHRSPEEWKALLLLTRVGVVERSL